MIIPDEILAAFEKEIKELPFGKVSIGLCIRDGYGRFEIDKHYTFETKICLNSDDKASNRKE